MHRLFNALIISLILSIGSVVTAATPTLLNYQGSLTTSGGSPVPDAAYSVVFTIYDAASAGTVKWAETQSVSTVGGLFIVYLGSVTPLLDSVFTGPTRYLGIKVGADPEIAPRTRLATVPYAYRVATIDSAKGGTIIGDVNFQNSAIFIDEVPFIRTTGIQNTYIGLNAGNTTATGFNTALGANTLTNITSGYGNTAIGDSSLALDTLGTRNTAVGYKALRDNLRGNYNIGVGSYALRQNTTGSDNTAVGDGSMLKNLGGSDNSTLGFLALFENIDGYENTAVGDYALYKNTVGTRNTALGASALINNVSGIENCAFGYSACLDNLSGSGNTALGRDAMSNNSTGNNNTAVGLNANVGSGALTNATAIGYNATVNASNKIRLGNSSIIAIEGQVAFTFTSDRNQKENFHQINGDEVLKKIKDLSLTSWNYKNQDPQQFRHYGPIAQEFFEAFGHDGVGVSGDSTTINSGDLAGIMLIAIQTLEKDKDQLRASIEAIADRQKIVDQQQNEIGELRKLVNELLSASGKKATSN